MFEGVLTRLRSIICLYVMSVRLSTLISVLLFLLYEWHLSRSRPSSLYINIIVNVFQYNFKLIGNWSLYTFTYRNPLFCFVFCHAISEALQTHFIPFLCLMYMSRFRRIFISKRGCILVLYCQSKHRFCERSTNIFHLSKFNWNAT